MAGNLFEMVRSRSQALYPDLPLRRAVSQAIAIESGRGWKITKEKQAYRIDPLVALSMAALGAVEARSAVGPMYTFEMFTGVPMNGAAIRARGSVVRAIELNGISASR
jgi:hypothetical protein